MSSWWFRLRGDRLPSCAAQGPVCQAPLSPGAAHFEPTRVRPQCPARSGTSCVGSTPLVFLTTPPPPFGSRLDAGRQKEHRDEEHGQVHCADTVSAHGQGACHAVEQQLQKVVGGDGASGEPTRRRQGGGEKGGACPRPAFLHAAPTSQAAIYLSAVALSKPVQYGWCV